MTKKRSPSPDDTRSNDEPQPEPTVLDWLKSVLRGRPIPMPDTGEPEVALEAPTVAPAVSAAKKKTKKKTTPETEVQEPAVPTVPVVEEREAFRFKVGYIRLPIALLLALIAQSGLENKGDAIWFSLILYLAAALLMGWAAWEGDFHHETPEQEDRQARPLSFRPVLAVAAVVLSILTFLTSGDNLFRVTNVCLWVSALVALLLALWEGEFPFKTWYARIKNYLATPNFSITLDGWMLAVLLGFGVSVYFRFAQLSSLPIEMNSDHAEKLLDVVTVLEGEYSIFFPRNTGREALQFYMAAATAKLLGTGISFLTLKIGTVLAGIITLPYIYLLGKEVGKKEVGLAAMVLAGVGYWPNVISRVGLRFALYPLFVAPAMYYLARGIRRRNRNDFLLCGLAVGVGLHGYSPARVIPILVAIGVGLYLLHRQARGQRWALLTWLVIAGLVALVVFLPLLRYVLDEPGNLDLYLLRVTTRMGSAERPLPGPALKIFLSNVWNGLRMYGWDDGEVWVNSIPHRPALDWITAALFHLGLVILMVRYIRQRNWIDLFLLVSIPILQLPSTVALAFPGENPALNRAAGAYIPAFIAAGVSLTAIPAWLRTQWTKRQLSLMGALIALVLFLVAAGANYTLVFDEYQDLYRRSAWNTSDAGHVISGFAESIGDYDTAHIVAYPHWFDNRLVGINAGQPKRDYAVSPDQLEEFLPEQRAQLFILNHQDEASVEILRDLFPTGILSRWISELEGKDFLIYFVPPVAGAELDQIAEPE